MASRANIRPSEVWRTIQQLGWRPAFVAFAGCFGQVLFMILRYHAIIPRSINPGLRRVTYAISLGHLTNTYFPARAGDVLKCFLLSRAQRGKRSRLSLLAATGAVVADRVLDVSVLLLMALIWRAFSHPRIQEWMNSLPLNWGVGILAVGVLVLAAVGWHVFLRQRSVRAAKWGAEFRSGMVGLTDPRSVGLAAAFAFVSWGGEALAIHALANSQGLELTFGNTVFVVLMLNLAISVPLSFANVGPFEAAVALSLTSFGLDSTQAVAVATVHHGLQLFSIGLWAAIALLIRER